MTTLRNLWLLRIALQTAQAATEWPRFRGPDGSGITAADAKPPTAWNDSQNLKWKLALPGPGSSSPIVSGERIIVNASEESLKQR